MHQIRLRLGLGPRPHWPCLQRSPRPHNWISGDPLLRGGRGSKGKGKEICCCKKCGEGASVPGKCGLASFGHSLPHTPQTIKTVIKGGKGEEREREGSEKREGERGEGVQ